MDDNELWRRLTSEIRNQPEESPGIYIVYTTLQGNRNTISVFDDYLQRTSTGRPRKIKKSDIIQLAHGARYSPNHRLSITDPDMEPGWMGSIVCSLLNLLPEFEYRSGRDGRELVYDEASA